MISKNFLWSIAGSAIPAASALLAIPILFLAIGSELFSICSLLISLAIFFFVYDFGIARAITYSTAKSNLDKDQLSLACRQGVLWAAVLGCLSALLVFLYAPWFVLYWLKAPAPELREPIIQSFRIAAFGIPASILCHVFRGVLEGHSDFKSANLGKMMSGATIFLSPLILVALNRPYIEELSMAISLTRYVSVCLYLFLAWDKVCFKKTFSAPENPAAMVKYGAWAAISGLISTLFIYGDRFVVAGYVEADTLAVYIGAQDILIRYLLIPWSMATVLLPFFAAEKMHVNDEGRIFNDHQNKIFWISLAFVSLVLLFTWLLNDWFSWLHLNDQAKWIVSLQAIGVFFAALSQMPLIYLFAKGKPEFLTGIYGFEFLLYIMLTPSFLAYGNGTGAGLLWAGRLILEYGLLSYAVNKNKRAICV
jgi:O-antigen/teichoic acid export membrane protein